MHDGERLAVDQAQGNPPLLAIVPPVIDPRQHFTLEDQGGIENIDTTSCQDLAALLLVPLEVHRPLPGAGEKTGLLAPVFVHFLCTVQATFVERHDQPGLLAGTGRRYGANSSQEIAMPDDTAGLITGADGRRRCWWHSDDPLYRAYHDTEWGRPMACDRTLFEKLSLEGFQAGLSWLTILRKRESFRRAFANFEIAAVARFGPADVDRLLQDADIVRHRGKIEAVLENASHALELQAEAGSLAAFVWSFEPAPASRPPRLDRATLGALGQTPESKALSKALKKRGWRFVGPTTCYAFMQAMGLVNDHLEGCCVRDAVEAARTVFTRPRATTDSN